MKAGFFCGKYPFILEGFYGGAGIIVRAGGAMGRDPEWIFSA
jgi:hypothetical protein